MRAILACVVLTLMACGSKTKPAATPENTEGASGSGSASAATCCCVLADKSTKMEAPAECTAAGGTCDDTESSCHGINEPVP